ncbi:unnamed protein product [Staurois parvus]|uniref:Uncharacterized protein n=1 Tax=Staurois parvus TaxID=386267 RepID=A0ABN9FV37_9NEOB|nr:unnamed protein product [Staurois parvus]
MLLQTQLLLCESSSDIITVLYIAFADRRAGGGAHQLHPLQAASRKPQEEAEKRPVTPHKEGKQQ